MDGIDRISQLPDPILQHILSFLLVKDAARTSVLSKVWNNAWTSLSCLNFGTEPFHAISLVGSWEGRMYANLPIVDRILTNRKKQKIPIRRFQLRLNLKHSASSCIDDWIKILVACNIEELFLGVAVPTESNYKLSQAIYAAKHLNDLRLDGFNLQQPSNGIKFKSLRELRLSRSFMDEQVLQALFASCSELEVLSFRDVDGLRNLQVVGNLPKLKSVRVYCRSPQFRNIDITAHNLLDLQITSFLGEIDVLKITTCKALKKLELYGVAVTNEWVEQLFSSLPNLETFIVGRCSLLTTMKISSDSLKYLLVISWDNLTSVDLNTPSLLQISCRWVCNLDPSATFKLKASNLLEASISLTPKIVDANWYSKLVEFLGIFKHAGTIKVFSASDRAIVIPKEVREDLLPPLHGTKCLHVIVGHYFNHSSVNVVDSLLWASQLNTLSFFHPKESKTLKFMYRDDTGIEDDKPCCASLPLKCWRHKLEKVKLQNFEGVELQTLRSYFSTNADNLEIIEEVPSECSI